MMLVYMHGVEIFFLSLVRDASALYSGAQQRRFSSKTIGTIARLLKIWLAFS